MRENRTVSIVYLRDILVATHQNMLGISEESDWILHIPILNNLGCIEFEIACLMMKSTEVILS